MSSNSSAAGSHPYSSDTEESNYLKRNRALHSARLALAAIISTVAIVAIACEAVPYRHYRDTVRWARAGLALWPLNFDIRPTVAALACASVLAFVNLIYVIVALLPSVRWLSSLQGCAINHANTYPPAAFADQVVEYRRLRLGTSWVHHVAGWRSLYHLPSFLLLPDRLCEERDLAQLDVQMEGFWRYSKSYPLHARLP